MAIDLSKIVDMAFSIVENTVKDSIKEITYYKVGTSTYNTQTGQYTGGVTSAIMHGIVDSVAVSDQNQDDSSQNKIRILLKKSEVNFEPSTADYLVITGDSMRWQVVKSEVDPTRKSLVTLECKGT